MLSRFANGKKRSDPKFWHEVAIVFTVFGLTGSTSMYCVRKLTNTLLGEGSLKEGPNLWRILYFGSSLPMYSVFLIGWGTLAGRRQYFVNFVRKMYKL